MKKILTDEELEQFEEARDPWEEALQDLRDVKAGHIGRITKIATLSPDLEHHNYLIAKYCIPNMGDYSMVGSELSSILDRLDMNRKLSAEDKQWIRNKGMFNLNKFVLKLEETGKADFQILCPRIEQEHKKSLREKLWEKYDIGYLEHHHVSQMIKILRKLEGTNRLSDEDVLWLSTHNYFLEYPEIKCKFHINEAKFYRQCFDKSHDPWQAVNASSHYRKANQPEKGLSILGRIDMAIQRDKHLKSAISTTKGGCKRDLRKFEDAIRLAEAAHSFDPDSFHPCTLLGAVHYEIGNYSLGDEWFAKAIERGANIDRVDDELRYIFMRADKTKQEKLKRHLLNKDPVRYSWVNRVGRSKRGHGKATSNNKPMDQA